MLDQGLLWFDPCPTKPNTDKVARAKARFEEKYGQVPDTCVVNPATPGLKYLQQFARQELHIIVEPDTRPGRLIPPDHFWIGRSVNTNEKKKRPAYKEETNGHSTN